MQKLLREYLDELNKRHRKNRRAVVAGILLVVMVVGSVAGILAQYGVAMTGTPKCGKEEHIHEETCYAQVLVCGQEEAEGHQHTDACYETQETKVLICGQEETEDHPHGETCYETQTAQVLICGQEEAGGHTHSADCFVSELSCEKEEHIHTDICYADGTADVEEQQSWDETYGAVEWKGIWGEDLVTAAGMQLGYEESSKNYTVAEDTGIHQGYTRYGQFAGDPYADWDAAFVRFCMHYAGLPDQGLFPEELDTAAWYQKFLEEENGAKGIFVMAAAGYEPAAGDLAFIQEAGQEAGLRMGIVSSYEKETGRVTVIEGDSENAVRENTYEAAGGAEGDQIVSYLKLTELETACKNQESTDQEAGDENAGNIGDEETGNIGNDEDGNTGDGENGETPGNEEPGTEGVLTEEERQQMLADVNALIAALPTEEELAAKQAELEEDEEAFNAYIQELAAKVQTAYDAYMALDEELRQQAEGAEYLIMLQEAFGNMTLEEPEGGEPGPEEKEHNARITGFAVTRVVDGTAPFDNHTAHTEKCYEVGHNGDENYLTCKQHVYTSENEESAAGDDRGAANLVVRTFDSVNYKFRATMDICGGYNGAITEARAKLQVILPATREQAAFNLEAMTWVDTTPGYEAKIENIILDENGGFRVAESDTDPAINGQLLTCWKHLESGRAVIPGFFENNVSVDVKSMKNGETFAPTFYAVLEDGFEYDIKDGTKVPTLNRGEGEDAKNPEKYSYEYVDEHKCPEERHGEVEMFRADAPEIRVSAAPKYNIRIAGADSERRQYNFADVPKGSTAANRDKGFQTGRMMRLGVTIQLYNDNASKGLKGIQLPDEDKDITFYLELSSKYRVNDPNAPNPDYTQGKEADVTEEYTPLLWSCGPNDRDSSYGKVNTDGRVIYDGYWGDGLAPYSDGAGEHGCQESGTWTATQEGSTIRVTVSGYKVDVANMPSYNRGQDAEVDNATYGAHIGCFSSGVLWILQPFNKDAETDIETDEGGNRDPKFDVVAEYGTGVFDTTIRDDKMAITTSDADGTIVVSNDAQMCRTDDESPHNLELLLPGVMINRVRYSDKDISKGVGVKSIRNGRDYASLGSEVWLMGGFTYYADRKEENQFYYGTSLVKFYGSAIKPLEDEPIEGQWTEVESEGGNYVPSHSHLQTYFGGGASASEISVYYAAKPDGSDWTSDKQMKETYEEDLVFYSHMADMRKDEKLCVGILYCFKGDLESNVGQETNDPAYECFHRAVVKTDDKLLRDGTKPVTYPIVSTSRVWTKEMFETDIRWGENSLDKIPRWNAADKTTLSTFPAGYMKSGNIEGSTWYEKTQYYDDGRGVSKDHNSDWSHWGDTLLLIGYKTYITKNLMQKTGGEDKQIFDLDGNQRVVDFKLTPSTGYNLAISQGEGSNPNITIPVITIVDTLPKYLRYRDGSAYLGGTYKQTAANGGRQGEIVGGTPLDAPETESHTADGGEKVEALAWNIAKPSSVDNEPVIIEAEDGSQTLIWRFYNREVGDKLPVIYYSADIGDRGNALTDVPEGTTNLVNKVRITAKLDRRHPSIENGNYAEVGIAVTKGSAGAYGKYSLQNAVEEDGIIDYVVYYDNNQDNEISVALMDNMPFNGVNGSKFTGTYKLTGWKLDPKLCEKSELTVWYTTDTRYKGLTLSDKDSNKNPVISIDEKHGWKMAVVAEDGTVSCPDLNFENLEFGKEGETFLAWAVTGTLAGSNCIDVSLSIQLIPEKPVKGDSVTREIYHYVNLFSTKDTITEIDTPTVRRTLEGLTWMDYNRNGKQDQHQNEEEAKLPGVRVTLMKLDLTDKPEDTTEEEWAKDVSHYKPVLWPEGTGKAGQEVTILTRQQVSLRQSDGEAVGYEDGRYKFTDLPAGIFAVRFTPGEGAADISNMRATIYDCMGNTQDEIDSDGVPVYENDDEENGRLERTCITQIEMEDAETIFYKKYPDYTQTSPYHDSGFYYNAVLNLHKVGENWTTKLSGASFILSDSTGNVMTFSKEDGTYIAPIDLGGIATRARYYIEYAADNRYVIGVEPTESHDGAWLKLFTRKDGDESQLFELFAQPDGSFSFRHCASGKWIDLAGGNTGDKTEIHLWENGDVPTSNTNQKWYVTPYGDGQYRIQAAQGKIAGNLGFMDLSNNSVTEGQQIWGYTGNGTAAQNWRLVPENENSSLKVDGNGQLTIKDLLPGEYTLMEMKTPDGCMIMDHPVKITVNEKGEITVRQQDVDDGIVKVEGEETGGTKPTTTIKVRNFEVYQLPSTGGHGIYGYMIGGPLLMMAGALILYRKKRTGRC